ncbi:MAG: nucleotide exchange factor GrpE [Phycisphaerae bacterium]
MSKKDKHQAQPAGDIEDADTVSDPAEAPKVTEPTDPTAALQSERDDLLNRLQRVSADYVNYQKRTAREAEQARQYANEQLIKALLGVLDDMERALEAARANRDEQDPLLQGMQIVHDKAVDTLTQFGLEPIEAEGKPFDPDLHQALMRQETDQAEPMTVLQVAQKGYTLKGRTLRPASVVVAAAPDGSDASSVDTQA